MKLCDIKEWIEDHQEATIGTAISIFILSILLFLCIPITETMTVSKIIWSWDIPVYEYTVHDEQRWYSAPDGAYDIDKKYEYHYSRTVKTGEWTDSNGNKHDITHSESVYDWKYYYKINKWDKIMDINSVGFDHKPHEAECNLEYNIPNPKIGDKKRGSHTEHYYIYGINKDNEEVDYKLEKEDWQKIDIGGKIQYKRLRFGDKIYNIDFIS